MQTIHTANCLSENHNKFKMDHLPRSGSRRPPSPAGKQHLPRLIRCNSENPASSPPSIATLSNKSNTVTKCRSRSTAKTRTYKEAEVNNFMINFQNPMTVNTKKTPPQLDVGNNRDGTFLPRRKPTSPSAWALSPGRTAPCSTAAVPVLKSPSPGGSSGIGGVLKYFRAKKVRSSEEADRHCSKLMNNRLLQWRFANARAETTMSAVQIVAEKKLFNAWIKILAIRNSNMVKRMEVQKLKNDIKLHHIMNSHLFLLEKWSTLEAKNFEAVGRVVRKLSVASVNIPLVNDSKGDVLAVCDVLEDATRVLENIESTITKLYYQSENSCYLLTELSVIAKQEKDCLIELERWMVLVASLKEKERSLRAHLIQDK